MEMRPCVTCCVLLSADENTAQQHTPCFHVQRDVLLAMVEAGHLTMADEHRQAWGLDPSVLQLSSQALEAHAATRAEAFLQLPQHVTIHMVQDAAGLAAAADILHGSPILGIDAEWRPATVSDTQRAPPSLLQVASATDVYLLDLLTLSGAADAAPALQSCLDRVLRRQALVLGFDVLEDLKKLAAAWPTVEALRDVPRLLDLQQCADIAGMVCVH